MTFGVRITRRSVKSALILCAIAAAWLVGDELRSSETTAEKPVFVCPPCGCAGDAKTFDKHGACPDCGMGLVRKMPERKLRYVAIVLFRNFEILDMAGPAEVFAAAMGSNGREFEVFTVSSSREEVESGHAVLTLTPEYTIDKCPKPDIVVIPGGHMEPLIADKKLMDWIKSRAADTEVVMSVCSGAFALAEAGLLDGLQATTHHGSIEHLKTRFPKITVLDDRRYVDNGRIITGAGVSAGIDAALHIVERLLGPEAADNTAKYMEYNRTKSTDHS